MLVLLHVLIAISSLVYTTFLFVAPKRSRFFVSYALVATTIGSGTYLVVHTHAAMLQSCMTGLAYLGVVTLGIAAAHFRLLRQTSDKTPA